MKNIKIQNKKFTLKSKLVIIQSVLNVVHNSAIYYEDLLTDTLCTLCHFH